MMKFLTVMGRFLLMACEKESVSLQGAGWPEVKQAKQLSVMIQAIDNANNNTPVAVDVVYTLSSDLAKKLSQMTAREYYRDRAQIIRDYVNEVMIHSWELPPGHTIKEDVDNLHPDTKQAFLFADYDIPGSHRARLPLFQNLIVLLGKTDFKVNPVG